MSAYTSNINATVFFSAADTADNFVNSKNLPSTVTNGLNLTATLAQVVGPVTTLVATPPALAASAANVIIDIQNLATTGNLSVQQGIGDVASLFGNLGSFFGAAAVLAPSLEEFGAVSTVIALGTPAAWVGMLADTGTILNTIIPPAGDSNDIGVPVPIVTSQGTVSGFSVATVMSSSISNGVYTANYSDGTTLSIPTIDNTPPTFGFVAPTQTITTPMGNGQNSVFNLNNASSTGAGAQYVVPTTLPTGTGVTMGDGYGALLTVANPSGEPVSTSLNSSGNLVVSVPPSSTGASDGFTVNVSPKGTDSLVTISNATTTVSVTGTILRTLENSAGAAGAYIGGELAHLLVTNNAVAALATSTLFSTAGQLIGSEISSETLTATNLTLSNVETDFEANVGEAIGGYAGALAGSALFKGLGVNPTFGSIIGGTIGAAVGTYAAVEIGTALGGAAASASLIANLESGLPGAAVGIFEQVTGLNPATTFGGNAQNAEIGSAVGGLIGTIVAVPFVGTVIGQYVGALIGSVFGPPSSVGPNSSTPITVSSAGLFALGLQTSDNNASASLISVEAGFAASTVALLNAELTVVGGTVGGTTGLEFVRIFKQGFWDSTNSAAAGGNFPNQTARSFSDYGSALNDAVIRQLQMTIISGGTPSLVAAMRNSFLAYDVNYQEDALNGDAGLSLTSGTALLTGPALETIADLNYDLQAVTDYQEYFLNPTAFLVGFAARYSATADAQAASDIAARNTAAAAADVANAPATAIAAWNQEFFRGALLQRVFAFFPTSTSETINDFGTNNTGHEGLLILDPSFTIQNASISRSGENLVITLSPTQEVTVLDAFASNQYTLGEVEFTTDSTAGLTSNPTSGSTWNGADLQTLLLAGNGGPIKFSAISLINVTGATKTISGAGTYTIVDGSTNVITLNGSSGGIALNGTGDTLTLSGSNDEISASGNQEVLSLSGNSDTTVANGQGDTITLNGLTAMLTAGGDSILLSGGATGTIDGISDTIQVGNGNNFVIGGNSMVVTVGGGGSTVVLDGNTEGLTIASAGGGDNVTANGQNSELTVIGGGNTITINGTSDELIVSGYGNALQVNGASGNTVTLSNYANILATAGTTIIFQDSSGGTITGGGNIITIGNSDNVDVGGAGFASTVTGKYSTVDYAGGYGSASITGVSDTLTVEGNDDVVTVGGSYNTVTVAGLGERLSVSGTGQSIAVNGGTVNVAAGAQVTFVTGASGTYTNGSIIDVGSGATVVVNGEGNSNNWIQASSSDTITLNGTGDGVGGSGTGNNVTFNGTNQYGYISSATLSVTSGSQVSLSGSSDTVTVAAGGTLSVIGDSNTITASGTGDSVTLGGSANHVSMTSGTLVLSGTDAPPGTGKVFSTEGFAYPSIDDGEYATAASQSSMQAMAATGANSIELVVTQYVESVSDVNISTSTTVPGSGDVLTTESDANLETAIAQAQAQGINVLLKPHVDIADGTWRAYLAPGANIATFFANYKAFIVHYAQIAQQMHVGMLSIGSELQSLTGAQYLSYWTSIISAVRAVYSGKLTYGSAWSETSSVSFWSQLDVIGAHPYENPTQISNPTVAQLDAGWNSVSSDSTEASSFVDPISGQQVSPVTFYADLAAKYNKPILFTEIGYRSVNGATLLDGNYAGYSYEDFQQQTNALEAFFQTFSKYSSTWLQGAYLWEWNPDPSQVVTQDFSVQGKPAMNVVDSWYGSATSATAQTANFLTGNSNSITVQDNHALTVSGSSNTLVVGNGASVQLAGSNNTVDFTGTASFATFIGGSGNVVSGNNETITVGSGAIVTVSGSGDTVIVDSGGTLSAGSIVSGTEVVLNGGTAVGLHVSASALQVSGGGIVSATVTLPGGQVYISSAGRATGGTVGSGGKVIVLSGGIDTTDTVASGGTLIVSAGGEASSDVVSSGGSLMLNSGGTVLGYSSNGGANNSLGDVYLSSGGEIIGEGNTAATTTLVSPGWTEVVLAGGVADGESIGSHATVVVSSGGMAFWDNFSSGGTIVASSGGVTQGDLISSGGVVLAGSGSVVNSNIVLSGGTIVASAGAEVNSDVISAGGLLIVRAGGGEAFAVASSGGTLIAGPGGSTNADHIMSGGTSIVSSGGVTNTSVISLGGAVIVSSGGTANGLTISGGGTAIVSAGGRAVSDHISSGGSEVISSGGLAAGGTVGSGGTVIVLSGGSDTTGTVTSGGTLIVSSGGVGSSDVISSGGSLVLNSGGTVLGYSSAGGANISLGDVYLSSGGEIIGEGNTPASTVTASAGWTEVVLAGGVADGESVQSGATVVVSSSGAAFWDNVSSGGTIIVSSGGSSQGDLVSSCGVVLAGSGSVVNSNIILFGGTIVASAGAEVNSDVISAGGVLNVHSGGAEAFAVASSGGTLIAGLGGSTNADHIMSGGTSIVSSGGVTNNSVISLGGAVIVSSGGTANGLIISGGGILVVSSGGTAQNATVMSGASATVAGSGNTLFLSGGTATVSGAGDTISAFGSGGSATISSGSVTVASGASVTLGGSGDTITVSGGATISALGSGNTIYATSASQVIFGGSAHGNVVYVGGQVAKSDDFVLGSTDNVHQLLSADLGSGASADPSAVSGLESAANSADGTDQSASEGAVWNTDTITVSLDGSATTFGHTLTHALDEWSEVSGKTFVIVDSSAHADISISLNNFDTSSTGLLGQTIYQAENGTFVPGVKIQLEDPTQLTFIGGSNGQMVYSGTNATFQQVALHEIGHALGLADSSDPHSIMYYGSGDQNRQLDATDLVNIASLYGEATSFSSSVKGGHSQWSSARDINPDKHGHSDLTSTIPRYDQLHPTIHGQNWTGLSR